MKHYEEKMLLLAAFGTTTLFANGAKVKNLSAANDVEVNLYAVWQ